MRKKQKIEVLKIRPLSGSPGYFHVLFVYADSQHTNWHYGEGSDELAALRDVLDHYGLEL